MMREQAVDIVDLVSGRAIKLLEPGPMRYADVWAALTKKATSEERQLTALAIYQLLNDKKINLTPSRFLVLSSGEASIQESDPPKGNP